MVYKSTGCNNIVFSAGLTSSSESPTFSFQAEPKTPISTFKHFYHGQTLCFYTCVRRDARYELNIGFSTA